MIKHIHLIECDSTQDILKEQLSGTTPADTILVSCETQQQGRGRGNNQWKAMPGSLCFSLNLPPHKILSFTALEISLLLVRFFENKDKLLTLKWPNDVWTEEGKKCAGVLVQGQGAKWLAGIGLNLFSEDPAYGGIYRKPIELDKKSWASEIADYLMTHRYEDTDQLKVDWQNRCGHLEQEVTITEGEEKFTGIFMGLGENGEALLKTLEGVKRIYNGSLRLTL